MLEVTCAILAGGRSRRFLTDKGLIRLDNKPLVTHVISKCSALSNDLIVVVHDSQQMAKYRNILPNNIKIIKDKEKPVRSPVLGIASALEYASYLYTLILPCDSPFVNIDVLRELIRKSEGFDAAIPRWEKGWIEPLHAVYKTEISKQIIRPFLNQKKCRIKEFIDKLPKVNYVPIEDLKRWDPKLITFTNINTSKDLSSLRNR